MTSISGPGVPVGRPLPARPGEAHEVLIVPGSAYSTEGRNAGLPANLALPWHYPVRAVCSECGQPVTRAEMRPGQLDWSHAEAG